MTNKIKNEYKVISNLCDLDSNQQSSLFNKIGEFLAEIAIKNYPLDSVQVTGTLTPNNNYEIQQNTENNIFNSLACSNEDIKQNSGLINIHLKK